VGSNIERLEPEFRIVVSDPSEDDNTLEELRKRFSATTVVWLGSRNLPQGWIGHVNELVRTVQTPYFMILPHDDEVNLDYVQKCLTVLKAKPRVGAVVGIVESISGPGLRERPQPAFPSERTLQGYKVLANCLLDNWNLGILFRAVMRRTAWLDIRPSFESGAYADLVWGYEMALATQIQVVEDAVYRKRFYEHSTHAIYSSLVRPSSTLPLLVAVALERVRAKELPGAITELVQIVAKKYFGFPSGEIHLNSEATTSESEVSWCLEGDELYREGPYPALGLPKEFVWLLDNGQHLTVNAKTSGQYRLELTLSCTLENQVLTLLYDDGKVMLPVSPLGESIVCVQIWLSAGRNEISLEFSQFRTSQSDTRKRSAMLFEADFHRIKEP
jgi:hypothetical protein